MKRIERTAAIAMLIALSGCKKEDLGKTGASSSASSSLVSAPVPKEIGTKFTKKDPTVGDKRTQDEKSEMQLKISMKKQSFEFAEQESTKCEEEILEVSNGAVTKMRVTFAEDVKTKTEGSRASKPKSSAVAGKTYVVLAKDGKINVLNSKDKPASGPEARLVENRYRTLGKPDEVIAAIGDRVLKEGDEVPELVRAIESELQPKDKKIDNKLTFAGTKVLFAGKEGDQGIFDVTVTMRVGGFMKMEVPLKGKLRARLSDAHLAAFSVDGPINLELQERDKKQGLEGNGTMKFALNTAYP